MRKAKKPVVRRLLVPLTEAEVELIADALLESSNTYKAAASLVTYCDPGETRSRRHYTARLLDDRSIELQRLRGSFYARVENARVSHTGEEDIRP